MNVFPHPPGGLGSAPTATQMLEYLGRLDAWSKQSRAELAALDAQVLATNRQAELNADMSLAMALWQAVQTRARLLLSTWDSGRVGPKELDSLASLIWGRLDTGAAKVASLQSMAVSLPEAGRLCDALIAQIRERLHTNPNSTALQIRLTGLLAQAERIREQLKFEPAALAPPNQAKLSELTSRIADLGDKQRRGGDIAGPLGVVETEAALLERDLIVGAARRRQGRDLVTKARTEVARLSQIQDTLVAAAEQARATVWPVADINIDQLKALGPVPNTAEAITAYLADLATTESAIIAARAAFSDRLAEREAAVATSTRLRTKATQLGFADDPVLTEVGRLITARLAANPTVLPSVRALLSAYDAEIDFLSKGGKR